MIDLVIRRKRTRLTPLIIFALIVVTTIVIASNFNKSRLLTNRHSMWQPELFGPMVVKQTFVACCDDLTSIKVAVFTFNRVNTKPITLQLYSADNPDISIIRESTVVPTKSPNVSYLYFNFSPVSDSRGKQFFFTLQSPDSVPGDAVSFDYTFHENDFDTALFLNGNLVDVRLKFDLIYNNQLSVWRNNLETLLIGLLTLGVLVLCLLSWKKIFKPNILPSWLTNWLIFIIYFGASLILYSFIFSPDLFFLYDDFALVRVAQIYSLPELFQLGLIGFYRPLTFVMLAFENNIGGWSTPLVYSFDNLLLHTISSFLIFLILKMLSGRLDFAFFTGLLFVAHFRHTESVSWISGRFDLLATFFYLLGLYLYLVFRETKRKRFYGLSLLSFSLSLLSKEMAVSFPLIVFLVEILTPYSDRGEGFRNNVGKILLRILPIVLILGVYLFIRQMTLQGAISPYTNILTNLTPRFILESYGRYFLSLLLPYFIPQFAPSILSILVGVIILSLLFRKPLLLLFFLSAFVISLAPVSLFRICLTCTTSERFIYLPSFFFCAVVAWTILELSEILLVKKEVTLALLIGYVLLNATGLVAINESWLIANRISKQVTLDFGRYLADSNFDTISFYNVPGQLRTGPYILKEYSFDYYYHDKDTSKVELMNFVVIDPTFKFMWPTKDGQAPQTGNNLVVNFDPETGSLTRAFITNISPGK